MMEESSGSPSKKQKHILLLNRLIERLDGRTMIVGSFFKFQFHGNRTIEMKNF